LIIDEITQQVEELADILNTLSDYEVDNSIKQKDNIAYFDKNKYEYVIMDHACACSDEFMEYVLTKDPKQKFILLSDSLNCPIACDFCLSTFQFVRLLKPVKLVDIFKYIQNKVEFVCPNQYRFENIDTIEKLTELINIDEYAYYNKKEIIDNCLYFRPMPDSNINVSELTKIQDLINKEYFTTSILEDFCIKVENRQ